MIGKRNGLLECALPLDVPPSIGSLDQLPVLVRILGADDSELADAEAFELRLDPLQVSIRTIVVPTSHKEGRSDTANPQQCGQGRVKTHRLQSRPGE